MDMRQDVLGALRGGGLAAWDVCTKLGIDLTARELPLAAIKDVTAAMRQMEAEGTVARLWGPKGGAIWTLTEQGRRMAGVSDPGDNVSDDG